MRPLRLTSLTCAVMTFAFALPPLWADTFESGARIKRGIEQVAPYAEHWSFIQPIRPRLPSISAAAWPRNEIDFFSLARLEAEELQPSDEADRNTLIRRVTLDLIGLPPTPAEVEAFVGDTRPDARQRFGRQGLQSVV